VLGAETINSPFLSSTKSEFNGDHAVGVSLIARSIISEAEGSKL
jgi:hypothetical protein